MLKSPLILYLVIKMSVEKIRKVQKSNILNQSNFTDFNLSCYRVLLTLISKLQRNCSNGELVPSSLSSRKCSLSVMEYAKEFNIETNTAYGILKDATDKLMKTSFSVQKDFGICKINVCSQAEYKKSQGKIDIEFTSNIMPHLSELVSNFTMYNLNEIAGFDSIYTTRFYELIMQFKGTGILEVSIINLRFHLGCENKYKSYKDFKKNTFAHAIKEINKQWFLNLILEKEIKTGRSVTHLKFIFKKSVSCKTYDPVLKKSRIQITRPRRKIINDNILVNENKILDSPIIKPKTVIGKILALTGAESELVVSAENNTGLAKASKQIITHRVKKAKNIVEKSAEDIKIIINAFMNKGMTKSEATVKAIELDLI